MTHSGFPGEVIKGDRGGVRLRWLGDVVGVVDRCERMEGQDFPNFSRGGNGKRHGRDLYGIVTKAVFFWRALKEHCIGFPIMFPDRGERG